MNDELKKCTGMQDPEYFGQVSAAPMAAQGQNDLHEAILRIPCITPQYNNRHVGLAYEDGHRDARHAAADLAAAPAAQVLAQPDDIPQAFLDAFLKHCCNNPAWIRQAWSEAAATQPAAAPAVQPKPVGLFTYEVNCWVATSSDDPRGTPLYRESIAAAVPAQARAPDVVTLRDALQSIRDMTDADNDESYRCDDREGCLDTVFAVASRALAAQAPAQGQSAVAPVAGQDERARLGAELTRLAAALDKEGYTANAMTVRDARAALAAPVAEAQPVAMSVWERFAQARMDVIDALSAKGMTAWEIAEDLALDWTKVNIILKRNRALDWQFTAPVAPKEAGEDLVFGFAQPVEHIKGGGNG